MYKNLEDKKKSILTAAETAEEPCDCACGPAPESNTKDSAEPPSPEINTAAIFTAEHWDVNG